MSQKQTISSGIQRYHTAVATLNSPAKQWDDQTVLEVLVARDTLQQILDKIDAATETENNPTTGQLLQIAATDAKLIQQKDRIAMHPTLAHWRQSFTPPDNAWWWHFEPPTHPHNRLDWLWSSLTIAALTANLALVADIGARFLAGSPGVWSSLAAIAPGILTLFAGGGALTKTGQTAIERLLEQVGVAKHYWHEVKLGIAVLLFCLLVGFHSKISDIATLYQQEGIKQYEAGNLAGAQASFERALDLNSDYPEAQFRLGLIYEDLQESEQAWAEYRKASQAGYLPSYNALARLYIIQDESRKAIALLNQAIAQFDPETDPVELDYALHKNLGWARLKQSQWPEAQAELEHAIEINPERADAYCLLAQIIEQQQTPAAALQTWEQCLRYLPVPFDVDTDRWLEMARQRVSAEANQE